MNIDGRIITPDNFYALYVEGVAPLSPAQGAARIRHAACLGRYPVSQIAESRAVRQCHRSVHLARTWVDGRPSWLQDKAYPWSRLREQPAQILRTTLFTTWEDGTSHLSVGAPVKRTPAIQPLRFARA